MSGHTYDDFIRVLIYPPNQPHHPALVRLWCSSVLTDVVELFPSLLPGTVVELVEPGVRWYVWRYTA